MLLVEMFITNQATACNDQSDIKTQATTMCPRNCLMFDLMFKSNASWLDNLVLCPEGVSKA